jgi:asparagine synthase (glutamine-hydrolysing)
MSGVFGVVDSKHQIDIQTLTKKMSDAMSYCQWHVSEYFVDEFQSVALGHIGIGIFNKESQPVWNPSGTVALVMAGELYNRDVLGSNRTSESDEQFVLARYESQGEDFVRQLNGSFIIGIYDKTNNRCLIINDRFGLYSLFYTCQAGRLIFSPEMKGILCDDGFHRKLDLTALAQYVRFQHLLGERTFFDDIHMLPAASVLSYDLSTSTCSVKSYWSFDDIPYRPEVSFDEAVEETGFLFRRAVNRLSADSYRPGVYLSGGLDSRSILGAIDRRPVASLTYGSRDCRDVYYARKIAMAAGSDHHWFDFPDGKWVEQYADFHLEITEGYHSWIHSHGINTLSTARQIMDVNLTGWDGGSVMGYDYGPLLATPVDDLALVSRFYYQFNQSYTWPSINEAEERMLYGEEIWGKVRGVAFESFQEELSPYLHFRPDVRAEYFFILNHCKRLTHNFITFTRSHVEVRFPFFDYDLFNFLYAIPASVRGNRTLYRAMIQKEMPRLAYIPYDHDELLPTTHEKIRRVHALTVKLKHRFNKHVKALFPEHSTLYADYENYLRFELREWAESILYDPRTGARGIFKPSFLRSIMNRHLSGLEEWTIGKIAPLMTYEMMLRRYYD